MAALPRWLSFILLPPHPSPFHSLLLLTIPVPAAVALQAELLNTLLEWTAFPFSSKDFLLVLHRLILITKPDPLAWFCQGRHSTQVDGKFPRPPVDATALVCAECAVSCILKSLTVSPSCPCVVAFVLAQSMGRDAGQARALSQLPGSQGNL